MSGMPDKKNQLRSPEAPEPDNDENSAPASLPDHNLLPDYDDDRGHKQPSRILRDIVLDIRFQIVAGILIFCIIASLSAPPVYRKFKAWRASQLMDRCEQYGAAGNLQKAFVYMRQAVVLAPGDEDIFRRVRLFNASIGDQSALGIMEVLMLEGQARPDELIVLAEQSLVFRKTAITKEALKKLEPHPSARRTIVEMQLTAAEGNPQAAVDLARASLQNFPSAEGEKILLATADLLLKINPEVSRQILVPLSKKNSENGLAALRLLANQSLEAGAKNSPESITLAKSLEAHPLRANADYFLAGRLRILHDPASKPAVLSELSARLSTQNEEEQITYARWLAARQYQEESLAFIGRDRALAKTEWLLIYLDSLAGLGRWNDVFTMLDANAVSGLSESIRMLFLARAAQKSGDSENASKNWREMHRSLQYEKPEVISFVAAYTMRIGENEQAAKVFTLLAGRRETALEGYLGIIRCTPKNAPAIDLIPIYNEFLEVFPNLEEAHSDRAYLQLLTNQGGLDAAVLARENLKKSPNSLAAMSIAALALLKNGEAVEADEIYKFKPIAWSTAPDPWKNIRAAVLYANGKKSEADEIASTIRKDQLRPEERALLPAD